MKMSYVKIYLQGIYPNRTPPDAGPPADRAGEEGVGGGGVGLWVNPRLKYFRIGYEHPISIHVIIYYIYIYFEIHIRML